LLSLLLTIDQIKLVRLYSGTYLLASLKFQSISIDRAWIIVKCSILHMTLLANIRLRDLSWTCTLAYFVSLIKIDETVISH